MTMVTRASVHDSKPAAPAAQATSMGRPYAIFLILGAALLMSSLDSTIVTVSIPTMLSELSTTLPWIGWVMTGYQFAQCVGMPVMGKLSDQFGRRRIFLISIAMFTAGSLAAGIAPNVYWLILFRVVQGFGGAAFMPASTGIVCEVFGERRSSAIGMFTSIFPIGAILGPNIGGLIIDHASWHWIFFVNVPIGIALFTLAILFVPESRANGAARSIDSKGIALFTGAILAILYAMTQWANSGSLSVFAVALFFVGIGLMAIFVGYELRAHNPLIDMKTMTTKSFAAVNVYNFFFGIVLFGLVSFVPYYATIAYGMTAGESGLVLTPRYIAIMLTSFLASLMITRTRYRKPMIVGALTVAASLALLSRGYHDASILGLHIHNLLLLSIIIGIGGIGMGIANPSSNNALLDLMPEKAAEIAGVRGMVRSTGGVIGVAITVLVLSHFQDKAMGMQTVYLVSSLVILLLVPVIFFIPDRIERNLISQSPGEPGEG